jgi:acyl transferase domain-containing protein
MNESFNRDPIVFLFGGQGSQYYQMGLRLYENDPVFKFWLNKSSEIIKELDPDYRDFIDKIYSKPVHMQFKDLKYTHPAIVAVEYALYKTLIEKGISPDYVLGSSLGEFTAAAVAETCDLRDILQLVLKQAALIEESCPKGGLTAVLGPLELYHKPELKQIVTLAGINFENHFTIAGSDKKLDLAESYLKEMKIYYQRLPVEYCFHSSEIDQVEHKFKDCCKKICFNYPNITMLSGYDGEQIGQITVDYFWEAVRRPVNFQKIIQKIEKKQKSIYIDLTPNGTMANFVKYNLSLNSESKFYSILSAFNTELKSMDKIEKEVLG